MASFDLAAPFTIVEPPTGEPGTVKTPVGADRRGPISGAVPDRDARVAPEKSPASPVAIPPEPATFDPAQPFQVVKGPAPDPLDLSKPFTIVPRDFPAGPTEVEVEPELPGFFSEFFAGLGRGVGQEKIFAQNLGALGAQAFGFDETAQRWAQEALEAEGDLSRPAVGRIEDISGLGDTLRWMGSTLGEQVPILATILASGGVAGVIGRLIAKRGLKKLSADAALKAVEKGMLQRATARGQVAGAFAGATGIETGATAGELFGATGEVKVAASLAAGVAKGALEAAPILAFGRRFGLASSQAGDIFANSLRHLDRIKSRPLRALATGGTGSIYEGATELAQEAIDVGVRDYVDENYELLSPETRSRLLNSAAAGAFIGFLFGGAGGAITSPRERGGLPETDDDLHELPGEEMEGAATEGEIFGPFLPEGAPVAEAPGAPEVGEVQPLVEALGEPLEGSFSAAEEAIVGAFAFNYGNASLVTATGRKVGGWTDEGHKPGQVLFAPSDEFKVLSVENRKIVRQGVKFTQKLVKLVMPNVRVLVTFQEEPRLRHLLTVGDKFLAMRTGSANTMNLIFTEGMLETKLPLGEESSSTLNSLRMATTVAHELGHQLRAHDFKQLAPGMQSMLLAAYNRSVTMSNKGSGMDFALLSLAPDSAISVRETGERANLPAREFFAGHDPDYYFGFDEWMAEQTARWATTNEVPLTLVDKVFKKLGLRMKKLLKLVFSEKKKLGPKVTPKTFEPTKEFQEYIDSVIARNQSDQARVNPILAQPWLEARRESERDNEIPLQGNVDPVAGQPESVPVKNVLNSPLISKVLPAKTRKKIGAELDKFNWFYKLTFGLLQIAELNPHIDSLQRYRQLVQKWYVEKMGLVSQADERVREWRRLGNVERDNLADFIFDVAQLTYLTKQERDDNILRHPTEAELEALVKKHKLTKEAQEVYVKVKADFADVLDRIQAISLEEAARRFANDPAAFEAKQAEIVADMAKLREKPYFPFSRFGKWYVVVKTTEGEKVHVEAFESQLAMKRGSRKLAKRFRKENGFVVREDVMPDDMRTFQGLPSSMMQTIRDRLGLTEEQSKWLDLLEFELSPINSFRKHMVRKEGVPGFSQDALRAYADYFFHAGSHLARMRFGGPMQDQISLLGEDIRQVEAGQHPIPATKRRRIQIWMQQHLDHVMNPGPDWAGLRSAAFMWWLGGVPSSAVLNLTQVPMVALPFLSAHYNEGKAIKALGRAYKNLRQLYFNPDEAAKTEDGLIRAIAEGLRQGFISESQATELAGTAHGPALAPLLANNKTHRALLWSNTALAWMFQTAEGLNRRVVFRAAYDLAKANPDSGYLSKLRDKDIEEIIDLEKRGFSDADAIAFLAGKDAILKTQFEYAQWARPEFMRGRKGSIFVFFMFTQNMLWFSRYSPGSARFLLMMMAVGGLMGLPGAEDLSGLARFLGNRIFGKDWDVEREVRELVLQLAGEDPLIGPDMLLHGASRVGFGLPAAMDMIGLPMPSVDMSGMIGLGRVVPGLAGLRRPNASFEEIFSESVTDVSGAAFGIGINLFKMASDQSLDITDWKRWERAMPRAMRNVTKAARFYSEERERSRTGATVVEFDPEDTTQLAEIAAVALGFTPTRLAQTYDRIAMREEAMQYWRIRHSILLQQYDFARSVVRDKSELRDVLADIRTYNREKPRGLPSITQKVLSQSGKLRQRARRRAEAGLTREKSGTLVSQEVNRLFPELIDVERVPR